MATTTEPVLTVSVEPILIGDESFSFAVQGRTRLVIEGEDAIVSVLHAQAIAAVEHLREITDSEGVA